MRRSITLATISLHEVAGGLERNIIRLANHLVDKGENVRVVTFDKPRAKPFFTLDERVDFKCLGETLPHAPIGFFARLRLIRRIHKALTFPDPSSAIVCFHHGILFRFFFPAKAAGAKIICSERNSLDIYNHINSRKWGINFLMMYLVDGITVQFPRYVEDYPSLVRKKISVVPNPVYPQKHNFENREKIILSTGRLVEQKQFDILIKAYRIIHEKHPDWRLVIVGDGPLKRNLKQLAKQLSINEKVKFVGEKRDLQELYSRATLYCQPSLWEGFPNAMAEAMAAGVIPVGFRETSGVRDLITNSLNGIICEPPSTPDSLAFGLDRIISSPDEWLGLSGSAAQISTEYSVTRWEDAWEEVLKL